VLVAGSSPSVGASQQFTATAVWSDNTQSDVTSSAAWASSNTAILTVSAAGLVTGAAAGSADIRAIYQSVTGSTSVAVTAFPCSFTASPLSVTLPAVGGSATINMTATPGCPWTARTDHPFMSVVSGASGTGSGAINVTMQPNTWPSRQGSVITTGPFVVLFNQAQSPCVTSATPVPATVPATGGLVTLTIVAPPGCNWSLDSEIPFVQYPQGRAGTGSRTVEIQVLPNGTGATRINVLQVDQVTATITQATPSGSYYIHTAVEGGMSNVALESPPYTITATAPSSNEVNFAIIINNAFSTLKLVMRAPTGQPLVPGTYLNAQTDPGASPSSPYLSLTNPFAITPRNCPGQFTVREAVYGTGGTVVRLWATFEQSCSVSGSLRGEISFGR
jgi:hypothetical protein